MRVRLAAWFAATLVLGGCNSSPARPSDTISAPQLISGPLTFPPGCKSGAAVPGQPAEPSLAADPTDPSRLVAAWLDNRSPDTVGIVVAISADGGGHWTSSILAPLLSCAGGPYGHATDPWVSVGPDGLIYVSSLVRRLPTSSASTYDVAVNVSRDHGRTWEAPVVVASATAPPSQIDKDAILADRRHPGIVYGVWANYQVTPGVEPSVDSVMFARSTDGGHTWSPPSTLYAGNDEAQENQLVMTAAGVLVDVFVEGSSLPAGASPPPVPVKIRVLRSTDQGKTWSKPIDAASFTYTSAVDPGTGAELRASGQNIVATVAGNTIYVAWFEDHRDFSSVLLARSDDGGKSWEAPKVVIRERAEAFLPTIAVSGDGTLGMLWFDFRHYRRGGSSLDTDVWFSTTGDRGSHWSERHAAGPFDLRSAPRSRLGPFIGDYMGLVGLSEGFVAVYVMSKPASRYGPSDVFMTRIPA